LSKEHYASYIEPFFSTPKTHLYIQITAVSIWNEH